MKEKSIKVEKTVKNVTKEELEALGYKEICTGGMMKNYPADKNCVGYAIFKKSSASWSQSKKLPQPVSCKKRICSAFLF